MPNMRGGGHDMSNFEKFQKSGEKGLRIDHSRKPSPILFQRPARAKGTTFELPETNRQGGGNRNDRRDKERLDAAIVTARRRGSK